MKKYVGFLLVVVCVGISGFMLVKYYSYIFSRKVIGKVVGVERVTDPTALIGGPATVSAINMFSFAVAIQTANGEIVTASTEDRQWAVVHAGQCAEADYFPYPPWRLDKAGTYFGARLLKLTACP
jgi:hypothetical protein